MKILSLSFLYCKQQTSGIILVNKYFATFKDDQNISIHVERMKFGNSVEVKYVYFLSLNSLLRSKTCLKF